MVELLHETNLFVALDVIKKKKFLAGPILGDAGLNVEIKNHPKGFNPDQSEGKGAILEFEWTGPTTTDTYEIYPEMDVLYDQHPHRAFLFVGSSKYLRLVNVKLKSGFQWSDTISPPTLVFSEILSASMWKDWLSSFHTNWISNKENALINEIAKELDAKPLIKIVTPPDSAYKYQLKRDFPNIE